MITHIPYDSLGKANHGWLQANHHFSFANYYNPNRMGFGTLRVINDDKISAGGGFAPHPHDNMEIITYVRSGAIEHQDSMGNRGITGSGEVQVMSAGTGVVHSEFNPSKEELTVYQIWIETAERDVTPRWEAKSFPTDPVTEKLHLLVSGNRHDEEALFIHQKAFIYGGRLEKATSIDHPITHQAYVLASNGKIRLTTGTQAQELNKGDGAKITAAESFTIEALEDSEIVVIDAPIS
jgi:hypothetical protein